MCGFGLVLCAHTSWSFTNYLGNGDLNDGQNWGVGPYDDDTNPVPKVPGPNDFAAISAAQFYYGNVPPPPAPKTVHGSLTVAGMLAEGYDDINLLTYNGTAKVSGTLSVAATVFTGGTVTAGNILMEGGAYAQHNGSGIFKVPVVTNGASPGDPGASFLPLGLDFMIYGRHEAAIPVTFVGSNALLSCAHSMAIAGLPDDDPAVTVTFSDGAKGELNKFGTLNGTVHNEALNFRGNVQFNLEGTGTSLNVKGDVLMAIGTAETDLPFEPPAQSSGETVMTIKDGASLTTGGKFVLADTNAVFDGGNPFNDSALGAHGTVNITGAGSKWVANGDVILGGENPTRDNDHPAIGTINVTGGGSFQPNGQVYLGNVHGSIGTLNLLDGNSSLLENTGALHIGVHGTGNVNVAAGYQFSEGKVTLAEQDDGTGNLNITGVSSKASLLSLTIGDAGIGNLKVDTAGSLEVTQDLQLGVKSTSQGTATFTGTSTIATIGGNLLIGVGSQGNKLNHVTVSDDAELDVNGSKIDIAQGKDTVGMLTVDGARSKVLGTGAATVVIGDQGTGTLELRNGAKFTLDASAADIVLGANSGAKGIIKVDGTSSSGGASTFTALGGSIGLGNLSGTTGELDVTNGGVVKTKGDLFVGRAAGATGTVTVSGVGTNGQGSQLNFTSADTDPTMGSGIPTGLIIGRTGTGTFNAMNGVSITADSLTMGQEASSKGTLTLGGTQSLPVSFTTRVMEMDYHATLNIGQYSNFITKGAVTIGTTGDSNDCQVNIKGTQATWTAQNGVIALGKNSTVTVSGGGTLNQSGAATRLDVGVAGPATLEVKETDSTVNATTLHIASPEQRSLGHLIVSGGGQVNATLLYVGEGSSTDYGGSVEVFGSSGDSIIKAETMVLTGGSSLRISSGGSVQGTDVFLSNMATANVGTSSSIAVTGKMQLTGFSSLTIEKDASVKSSTLFSASLTHIVDNGTITTTAFGNDEAFTCNGFLSGSGAVNGRLIVNGKVQPGLFGANNNNTNTLSSTAAPAAGQTLTVNGNYEQGNGGILAISIAGTEADSFSRLLVNGKLTLDSGAILELDFMNGFAPKAGDKFDFLGFTTVDPTAATFSTVDIEGLEPGFQYVIAPDPTQPGQYAITALNDGVPAPVPEPSTLVLFGLALACGIARRYQLQSRRWKVVR